MSLSEYKKAHDKANTKKTVLDEANDLNDQVKEERFEQIKADQENDGKIKSKWCFFSLQYK